MKIKYPEIVVDLNNQSLHAFSIIGSVRIAMRKHNVPEEEIHQFSEEAIESDYVNLIKVCQKWVTVK